MSQTKVRKTNEEKVFFLAGEQSGDLHGSLVIKSLKKLQPQLQIYGVGGPMMQSAGMNLIHSSDELAVIGFVEVLKNISKLFKILNDVKKWLKQNQPKMIILIDYPGFNQRVAAIAKSMGIHVLYYICPQVWAWNAGRTKKISAIIDEAVVVLPFEVEIWKKEGTTVNWFGHPLVGIAKSSNNCNLKNDYSPETPIISLLPGSRSQEIHYILPIMLEAAKIINKQRPDINFFLPVADTIDDSVIMPYLKNNTLPIKILRGQTYDAISTSNLCLVTSGTATLETAIIGTPMIIVYKVNWLTSIISKFLIQAQHIGLPNLIAGKTVVPEFIRNEFKPSLVANEAIRIINDENRQKQIREQLSDIRKMLGESGASTRVAKHISERLKELTKE